MLPYLVPTTSRHDEGSTFGEPVTYAPPSFQLDDPSGYNPSGYNTVTFSPDFRGSVVPSLQDDEELVRIASQSSTLTPRFEASHCQRMFFVLNVVLRCCEWNQGLAVPTWVELLEGVTGGDVWLWSDNDESLINDIYPTFRSDSTEERSRGWKLTNSDLRAGIRAIERRVERVREGIIESLVHVGPATTATRRRRPEFALRCHCLGNRQV